MASTGMDGRPEVWTVMSAIDGGPGYAAFFVGGRTWIPAFAGMTGEGEEGRAAALDRPSGP